MSSWTNILEFIGVFSGYGPYGLIILVWFVDSKRIQQQQLKFHEHQIEYKEQVCKVLKQYETDVRKVTDYYKRNVELVERYGKLADDLAKMSHLNTQVQTQLVEKITNNMFCPLVREQGPKRS